MNSCLFSKQVFRLLACVCAMAACIFPLLADDTADALKALQAAVEKEAAQKNPEAAQTKSEDEGSENYGRRGDMGMMFLAQVRAAIARGEPSQLDELLNQIPVYLKSEAVRDAADKLRTAVNAERAAKDQEFAARIDAAITAASKAVQDAKKPADLDETLSSLARLQEQGDGRYSDRYRARIDKVQNARQFVVRWQDYLANLDSGNLQQAIQNLQNASNENSANMIPRSEILAKIEELTKAKQGGSGQGQETLAQKISKILDKTKSLDAIPAAIDALNELQRQLGSSNNYNDPVVATRNELKSILQAYRAYQAGIPCQLPARPNGSNPETVEASTAVLPLRVELLLLTAPRILNVGENLKPAAGETMDKYLARVMADAQERADAGLIGRVRELQDSLSGKQNMGNSLGFLQTLLAAQNQEAAGQFAPAVISYQLTLKSGGELVPAKAIGLRLEGIKTAHPEDFEKGMQLFLNNQTPSYPRGYSGNMQPSNTVTIPGPLPGNPAVSPSPSPANKP